MGRVLLILLWFLLTLACSHGEDNVTPRESIDLGIPDTPDYNKTGTIEFTQSDPGPQEIKFEIDTYSEFSISLSDIRGRFYLERVGEGPITHNGQIKEPSFYLPISGNFNYSVELLPGEYLIIIETTINDDISGVSQEVASYSISIREMEGQEPHQDLGVISIPYNTSLNPIGDTQGNSIYEFEVSEDTYASVVVDAYVCGSGEYAVQFLTLEGEPINGTLNVPLVKGKYKLSMDTVLTLILNDLNAGDVEFGIITELPHTLEVNIDMEFEPDAQQRFYFEVQDEVTIQGFEFVTPDLMTFLYRDSGESVTTSASTGLTPGKYYILYEIDGLAWGNCDQEYRLITGSHEFQLTSN